MAFKPILILIIVICAYLSCHSQDSPSTLDKITNFPDRFFSKVQSKAASLESKLDRQTEKYLQRLLKKEKKLKRKLRRTDSAAAEKLFGNAEEQYAAISGKMNTVAAKAGRRSGQYLPYVDSLKTSLSFLEQNSNLLGNAGGVQERIQGSLKQVSGLQAKLGQTEQVKAFIRRRKEQIKQTLSRYTKLPKGLSKTYSNFNKDLYYYSQQVKEYRDLLNDPDKLTRKALSALTRLNVFRDFMSRHSELAGLFALPANYGTPQVLTGLQTRSQVQQMIQTRLAAGGPNAQQMLQQNLQAAQQQMNQLKDKINKLGGGSSDMEMPDFKPNNQKTKSFLQRLEIGTNLQSTKSNYFFLTTTDLGLSIGYKLSDNSIIGIGGSYKVGWGKDIRHIVITSEGAGLRSFLDVKLKKSFYVSGGFEYNYQNVVISPSTGGGRGEAWTQSGLIGISKVVSLKTKFFKKTKLQLLWDFLSYEQQPRTQTLKFRVGYCF